MIPRRRLLQAALAAPLTSRASAAPAIRTAFLGASHSHGAAKVDVVRNNPRFQLAGICEPDLHLRDKFSGLGIPLLTQQQLLDDATITLIAVESDVPDHARHARLALEAGKHVHLEKPPATDLQSLRELLGLAARGNLLLQQGYMWRHHSGINTALEAARRGWLGDVFEVRGTIHTLTPPAERVQLARFPGGQMFELGCHLIDPLIRLLGQPSRVTPLLQKHGASTDDLADNTIAVFEFPHAVGVIMSSSLQQNASRQRAFEIFGTNGNAVLRPIEPPTLQVDLKEAAGPYQAGSQLVPLPAFQRYIADFEQLADAISSGARLPISTEEELRVQHAILAASKMT